MSVSRTKREPLFFHWWWWCDCRNELTVLEQADHLLRRSQILEAKGLRSPAHGNGSNQHSSKSADSALLQTTAAIAADMGMSERTAQERLQIARNIAPDVKEQIAETPVADSTTQQESPHAFARLSLQGMRSDAAQRLACAVSTEPCSRDQAERREQGG